tara:strand:- start:2628 stop:3377 length:750 start_codon:yes stop_codon:yes gene_type:complete
MSEFEMIANPVSEEQRDLIPPNDKNESTELVKNTETCRYLFDFKNISRIIIHVFLHISLLSILEPLFYFLYVVTMEKDLFFNQLKVLINKIIENLDVTRINEILSNPYIIDIIIDSQDDDVYIDNYFNNLKIDYESSMDENNNNRQKLERKAYTFSAISFLCTILYFIFHQCLYKEKYLFWKVFMEHIILVLFIGFYEYWFFNNIILHYSPWTDEEITYYIVTCTWTDATKYIPTLNTFIKNETTCELK